MPDVTFRGSAVALKRVGMQIRRLRESVGAAGFGGCGPFFGTNYGAIRSTTVTGRSGFRRGITLPPQLGRCPCMYQAHSGTTRSTGKLSSG